MHENLRIDQLKSDLLSNQKKPLDIFVDYVNRMGVDQLEKELTAIKQQIDASMNIETNLRYGNVQDDIAHYVADLEKLNGNLSIQYETIHNPEFENICKTIVQYNIIRHNLNTIDLLTKSLDIFNKTLITDDDINIVVEMMEIIPKLDRMFADSVITTQLKQFLQVHGCRFPKESIEKYNREMEQ